MASVKNLLVLACTAPNQKQDYYRAGTLAEIRALYKATLHSAKGDAQATRRLKAGMRLYRLNAQPQWKETTLEASSLTATFQALRQDGLKTLGVDQKDIAGKVQDLGNTLKKELPGLGRDLLGAAKGGMLEKLAALGSATSLFGKVSGSVQSLKTTGEAALETLQNRLAGYEGDGIITSGGEKLVHARFLANPANAVPADLKILQDVRKTAPKPKQQP